MYHYWLIKNDEKNYYYVLKAKNRWTMKKRIDPKKETIIGREDELRTPYKELFEIKMLYVKNLRLHIV